MSRETFNHYAWDLFTFIHEAWPETDEDEEKFNDTYQVKSSIVMGKFLEQYDRERGNGLPQSYVSGGARAYGNE